MTITLYHHYRLTPQMKTSINCGVHLPLSAMSCLDGASPPECGRVRGAQIAACIAQACKHFVQIILRGCCPNGSWPANLLGCILHSRQLAQVGTPGLRYCSMRLQRASLSTMHNLLQGLEPLLELLSTDLQVQLRGTALLSFT